MKRIVLILSVLALGLSAAAQVDSAALIQAQQQADLLQQQQELSEQEALIAKQMKEAKRAERREKIGRNGRLAIAPNVGLGAFNLNEESLYHAGNYALGVNVTWHQPIAPKWNLDFGLGYQWNMTQMYNHSTFNTETQELEPYTPQTWGNEQNYFTYSTIEVPVLLGHVNKSQTELYFGLRLGVRLGAHYHRDFFTYDDDGELDDESTKELVGFGKNRQLARFSSKLVVGSEMKRFLFPLGYELYFDLVPLVRTFPTGQKVFMNEWGVRLTL